MNGKTYKVESDNEELAGHSIGMLSQEQLFQVILMATNSQSPVQVIKQAFVVWKQLMAHDYTKSYYHMKQAWKKGQN